MEKIPKLRPPCYVYDYMAGKWQPFQSLQIEIPGSSKHFFRYDNYPATSKEVIRKEITHEYIVYYSKLIPSNIKNMPKNPEYQSAISEAEVASKKDNLNIKSIIILDDLSRHYESVIENDQYILLGFVVQNHVYEEENSELKMIRDMIADMHVKLKYSQDGLIYQIKKRTQLILYKTLKYSFSYIARLCNVASGFSAAEKLVHLQKMYNDLAFQEFLDVILKTPAFVREVTSLTYKTIASVGLFPAYVELNTMNQAGIILKIKNLVTNPVNAPYGSQHHAAFSLGNFRYSFVFHPRDKEKQRVNIASEIGRYFSLKNQSYKYFRVKFFDYFPMDSWVHDIANRALVLMKEFFLKVSSIDPAYFETPRHLKDFLKFTVEEAEEDDGAESVTHQVARDFFEKYRTQLDEECNERLFKKITRLIADADVRGYKNLSNNCQTIVSEIVSVFGARMQKFVEPLFDLSKIPYMEDFNHEDLRHDFLKFGSQFNYKFTNVAPFPLTYRLSYFDTFADKDSCQLFYPKKFENMEKHVKEYLQRGDVSKFLLKLEDELTIHSFIHIHELHNKKDASEKLDFPDISFGSGSLYSIISCLLSVLYNELFNIKREIKIAKNCGEELEEYLLNHSELKKEQKKWKANYETLPSLFERKYKLLDMYKELCFYYYNSVRLGLRIKLSDKVSVLGFLIIKKPSSKQNPIQEEVKKDKSLKEEGKEIST